MTQLPGLLLVIFAASSVAIADILIKHSTVKATSFWEALQHPYMLLVIFLYLMQVVLYAYVFFHKWDLGGVGVIQTVCYALIVVIFGVLLFNERPIATHVIGMVAALAGVVLMNT